MHRNDTEGITGSLASRLVYLSSSMHRGGRASLAGMDWGGHRTTGSYSDSKLFVTTLAAAVARTWADVFSNAVDPSVHDQQFQDQLLEDLARVGAPRLPIMGAGAS
jgi:NAD(P)-dependent dehydrogenase (short-subunit alcohol dehydrogenase family)